MPFSCLNIDVIFEIFLHFVAIDWNGPFTLLLVCSKWRDFTLSKARLWTWVNADDCQLDWKDRVHVAVALSRNLPMQLVVKIPFRDIDGLVDTLPRCRVVFLDTSEWSHVISRSSALITHEEFIERREAYQELHIIAATTLSLLERRGIELVVETEHDACFSFSTWTIFERVFKARSLKDQTNDLPLHLITALVFEDQPRRSPRRVRLLNVWPYLPSFPYLRSLEISDNFIGGENPSTMPEINLPSLVYLAIDCATGWLFRTKGQAFDLFSLLRQMKAPALQTMILNGSLSQLINAMMISNETIRPPDLTLSLLSLADIKEYPYVDTFPGLDRVPMWKSLHRLTIDSFDPKRTAFIWTRWKMEHGLLRPLKDCLTVLPKGCTLRLRGGEEIEHIMRLNMPNVDSLDIICRDGSYNLMELDSSSGPAIPRIRSLTLTEGCSDSPIYFLWATCAEQVFVEAIYLGDLLEHISSSSNVMTALDTSNSAFHQFRLFRTLGDKGEFTILTKIRCTTAVATGLIDYFDTPQLQDITLIHSMTRDAVPFVPFEAFADSLMRHSMSFLQLSTLAIEGYPPWRSLLHLVAVFNKPGKGGIATVRLPGLPHPFVLRLLVDALKRSNNDEYAIESPTGEPSITVGRKFGCRGCLWGGWSCSMGSTCPKFSTLNPVSITRETVVDEYNDEDMTAGDILHFLEAAPPPSIDTASLQAWITGRLG